MKYRLALLGLIVIVVYVVLLLPHSGQPRPVVEVNTAFRAPPPTTESKIQRAPVPAKQEPPVPPKFERRTESGAIIVSFQDLNLEKFVGVKDMTPAVMAKIPKSILSLHGQQIRVRGNMIGVLQEEDIQEFLLEEYPDARFGHRPIWEIMHISLAADERAKYEYRELLTVEGRFRIEFKQHEDFPVRLYFVENAHLVP